jgi:hypothetical protein
MWLLYSQNAKKVHGKDLGLIKGKTVREKAEHVLVKPSDEPDEKQFIVLSVDIMYYMGIPFLITVARDVRFITSTALSHRKMKMVWNALKLVVNLYKSKGYSVDKVEFSASRNEIHMVLVDN